MSEAPSVDGLGDVLSRMSLELQQDSARGTRHPLRSPQLQESYSSKRHHPLHRSITTIDNFRKLQTMSETCSGNQDENISMDSSSGLLSDRYRTIDHNLSAASFSVDDLVVPEPHIHTTNDMLDEKEYINIMRRTLSYKGATHPRHCISPINQEVSTLKRKSGSDVKGRLKRGLVISGRGRDVVIGRDLLPQLSCDAGRDQSARENVVDLCRPVIPINIKPSMKQ